jgi:hypothetical protein
MITAPSLLLVVQAIATGSIAGALHDANTNEPLGGAVLAVVDLNRTAVTDGEGRYRFDRVPPGSHRLLVRRIGYAPRTLEAIVPPDGTVDITIALRPEPIVLGPVDGANLAGDGQSVDHQIDAGSLRNHPLLAEPDVFQALSYGVVAVQPEAPDGMHVRGGASDQVAYLLDGLPVFSPYHSGESFSAWNPDALANAELRPAVETWDALSGVVSAASRTPGSQHHARAGISTTQMRLTLDGPLGSSGAGYLWSERSGFPGFPRPQREATYVRGEAGDQLAKLEAPFGGGRLRLLGYANTNELDADGQADPIRNTFDWQSTTIGAEWTRPMHAGVLRAQLWTAGGNANAEWHVDSLTERLATGRHDAGLSVTLEKSGQRGRTTLVVRVQRSRMSYHVSTDSSTTRYDSDAPLAVLFVERTQSLGAHVELVSGIGGTTGLNAVRLSPRATLYWSPASGVVVSSGFLRLYQFAQSLRNPESVAGAVFPVDLYVGASRFGVPIARSDEGIVTAEYRSPLGLRFAAQGYVRALHGIILVAPRSADPFATATFATGSGRARGIEIDVTRATTRYTAFASYGRQYARFAYGGNGYVPDYGATHAVDAGIMIYPSHSWSLRFGASGRFGRRVTALATPFEWESCNVADQGCEFAGSPRTNVDSLGAARLPGYLRLDLGVRRRWSIRIADRISELAVFGTLTNVFARTNVLTFAPSPDASTGAPAPVTLRSRVPLVIGVDWAF